MPSTEQLTLPISLPKNRQTFYPYEVMEMLSMDDKQLRLHESDGTLISINIARKGLRKVRRYTVESVEEFIRARNSRDNPN
jgi:hypothetical protein